jgi:hypothetical protein
MEIVTEVWPESRLFAVHDPTYNESSDILDATNGAIAAQSVGWAPNAMVVCTAFDLADVVVKVQLWKSQPPEMPADEFVELFDEHHIALPGGQIRLEGSTDTAILRGLRLPTGPGTYRLQLFGYGLAQTIQRREAVYGGPLTEDFETRLKAVGGLEHYLIRLWHVDPLPHWDDDERQKRIAPSIHESGNAVEHVDPAPRWI